MTWSSTNMVSAEKHYTTQESASGYYRSCRENMEIMDPTQYFGQIAGGLHTPGHAQHHL